MEKQQKIVITFGVIIVVAVLVWLVASRVGNPGTTPKNGEQGAPANQSSTQDQQSQKPSGPITREALAAPVKIPEKGDAAAGDVAVPTEVSAVRSGSNSSKREFNIEISKGEFKPSEVIVKLKDTVTLNFTATDGDYDFTQPDFGFSVAVPKGTKKTLQMDATAAGQFLFYCKSCGGPDKGPKGHLVVSP